MNRLFKRPLLKIILAILLGLSLLGAAPYHTAAKQIGEDVTVRITQVDTSQFPNVTVYVSVVDKAGEPFAVDSSRLQIEENGKPISSAQLQGIGEVGPLTTMLVMDVSGSMNSALKLRSAKAVSTDYVNQMRQVDQAGLLSFNTEVNYNQAVTGDRQKLLKAIDSLRADGDTAMYDAILKAVEALNPISGRKAIIALTDGLDNRSKSNPDDVIQAIGAGGLSISTVGLGEPGLGAGVLSALNEEALRDLAQRAGGLYGYANDQDSLKKLYELYGRVLRSEYVITYTSPSTLRDGVNRALSVSLLPVGGAAGVSGENAVYNPGGLVPEVAEKAPWPLFFILLAGLLLLLGVPFLIGRVLKLAPGAAPGRGRSSGKKPRIRLL